ncbi:DNA binding protein [Puccinia graminis f. sp. tritici]|uniref:DNA binding protein n=1 Tax=Puccinia graminis f. sp. tritici TaxID=56615 RepID=A0A5B0PSS4_PUCGR|nr:DNA binding protein [Puccinia graminis f. sp. tritici]
MTPNGFNKADEQSIIEPIGRRDHDGRLVPLPRQDDNANETENGAIKILKRKATPESNVLRSRREESLPTSWCSRPEGFLPASRILNQLVRRSPSRRAGTSTSSLEGIPSNELVLSSGGSQTPPDDLV